jgi:hypothetical protein
MMSKKKDYLFYFSQWTQNTYLFRNLLNSSKGRDKFCQFLQYVANFYCTCMRESQEYGEVVRARKDPSVNKAKKFESSISNGRKIFRLFLWLNEIAELNELLNFKKYSFKMSLLKIISTTCSFIYYLTDNIVYLANLDICSPFIPYTNKLKWKRIKNIFSLTKTILEIFISVYAILLKNDDARGYLK